ncbi:hypothetical protein BpHYR1_045569 [Brachionus plicatilis]|uniref:Uncharacterized protein n=1 Tax=Brachionus plicatilis TaxID=10195 RepID=A0A3M7QLU0_BRAPC|nr:hypothetical protein BpHYR1_045569 [Brachionus plicatilis]
MTKEIGWKRFFTQLEKNDFQGLEKKFNLNNSEKTSINNPPFNLLLENKILCIHLAFRKYQRIDMLVSIMSHSIYAHQRPESFATELLQRITKKGTRVADVNQQATIYCDALQQFSGKTFWALVCVDRNFVTDYSIDY